MSFATIDSPSARQYYRSDPADLNKRVWQAYTDEVRLYWKQSRSGVLKLLLICAVIFVVFYLMFSMSPIPQDPQYHNFADKRQFIGIPNCLDVLSNFLFLWGGVYGIYVLMWRSGDAFIFRRDSVGHVDYSDQIPWWVLFLSSSLISVGSAYYHWNPTTQTLFWDRLPMTISFMSVVDIIIAERISSTTARRLFLPLLLIGVGSVLWWEITERFGSGDLRLYVVVQIAPMLLTPLMIGLYPDVYTHSIMMLNTLVCYIVAKAAEHYDHEIFALTYNTVSGHTLKHLVSGYGLMWLPYMLTHRRPVDYKQK